MRRTDTLPPFLKWAGGKRWFISKHSDLLPDPKSFKNYFEPFLGGGATYFHLSPQSGILSDINRDLINLYEIIKDDWRNLEDLLKHYHILHNEEFYYNMRAATPTCLVQKAARFLYLNRTCWNGLYRVNRKGEFNVPIGTKAKVFMDTDDFAAISKKLANMTLRCCDFEDTIDRANEGDFVFIDPPYTVKHNNNGFVKYNENIFSWSDQVRLKQSVVRAIERGVKILLTNANHDSIKDLYFGVGRMTALNRSSVISGKTENRGVFSELIIKSWR